MRRYNTIIFVPHARARFRKLTVSNRLLAGIAASAAALFIAAVAFGWAYLASARKDSEFRAAVAENARLKTDTQELTKKLKLFATVTVASTLVVDGKQIKETRKELAANQKTSVKAKLKRKSWKKLARELDRKGKAEVKITASARSQSGVAASDRVKVKLKD